MREREREGRGGGEREGRVKIKENNVTCMYILSVAEASKRDSTTTMVTRPRMCERLPYFNSWARKGRTICFANVNFYMNTCPLR